MDLGQFSINLYLYLMKKKTTPDYIFEASWEVCNLVGGIYTVLSTKARTLQEKNKDKVIFFGPDLEGGNIAFKESATLLKGWRKVAADAGLKVKVGRWQIPGTPIAILVDFKDTFAERDAIYGQMWNDFGIDSLPAYGDYDESCMFAVTVAKAMESFYNFIEGEKYNVVAHFDEWTTGMGLLYIKKNLPSVATVFTTHATSVGRSIASNGKSLYDYLPGYFGDQMAAELNMVSKHSVEKNAALNADAFTTVSSITAKESTQLIGRTPDVTPNGFEEEIVPAPEKYAKVRAAARKSLLQVAAALSGKKPAEDALLVTTSGRNEFRNKGIDLYLDSLKKLSDSYNGERQIIAFILVPAWAGDAREDVVARMKKLPADATQLDAPFVTHALYNYNEDNIINKIRTLSFNASADDKIQVIYVPSYLKGDDGILNKSYYQVLPGFDLTIFPSYYEPWGYTPLESVAFGIPTVTTSLSGFGMWVIEKVSKVSKRSGVYVIPRTDANYDELSTKIAETIASVAAMKDTDYKALCDAATATSKKALWSNFIAEYEKVYEKAIKQNKKTNK